MKTPTTSFKDNITMSALEKQGMWQSIEIAVLSQTALDGKNVIIPDDIRHISGGRTTPLSRLFSNFKNMTPIHYVGIAIGLMATTSGLAQNALPGDALYGVKVHFNENVKTALAVDAESDARAHLDIIANRIAERDRLKSEGRLDSETQATLDASIMVSSESYQRSRGLLVSESADSNIVTDLDLRLTTLIGSTTSVQNETSSQTNSSVNSATNVMLGTEATTRDTVNSNTQNTTNSSTQAINNLNTSNAIDNSINVDGNSTIDANLNPGTGVNTNVTSDVDAQSSVNSDTTTQTNQNTVSPQSNNDVQSTVNSTLDVNTASDTSVGPLDLR